MDDRMETERLTERSLPQKFHGVTDERQTKKRRFKVTLKHGATYIVDWLRMNTVGDFVIGGQAGDFEHFTDIVPAENIHSITLI